MVGGGVGWWEKCEAGLRQGEGRVEAGWRIAGLCTDGVNVDVAGKTVG